jgi:hypothetical protein
MAARRMNYLTERGLDATLKTQQENARLLRCTDKIAHLPAGQDPCPLLMLFASE